MARRQQIVEAAARRFAESGFAVSTRDLAQNLGVTQALLYKYFASKDELVEAVFERLYLEGRQPPDTVPLSEVGRPLAERLARFYACVFAPVSEISLRVFLRAALDGLPLPERYASRLDERVLWPVLETLRAERHLPDLATRGPTRGERELVLMLHGSLVFLAIRRHVYRMPLDEVFEDLMALQLRVYVPGALAELDRLQRLDVRDPLAARVPCSR